MSAERIIEEYARLRKTAEMKTAHSECALCRGIEDLLFGRPFTELG